MAALTDLDVRTPLLNRSCRNGQIDLFMGVPFGEAALTTAVNHRGMDAKPVSENQVLWGKPKAMMIPSPGYLL